MEIKITDKLSQQVLSIDGKTSLASTEVIIGEEQPDEGKLWIDTGEISSLGTEVVDSVNGTQTNKAPSVRAVVQDLVSILYPVGSIYMSTNATNPKDLFGIGEWEQIKDTFLMSAGTTYGAGTTGGTASHTHSFAHTHGVPGVEHTHSIGHTHAVPGVSHSHGTDSMSAAIGSPSGNVDALGFIAVGASGGDSTYSVPGSGGHTAYGHPGRSHNTKIVGSTNNTTPGDATTKSQSTSTSGKTTPSATTTNSQSTSTSGSTSNLPPYLAVFTWKRVS